MTETHNNILPASAADASRDELVMRLLQCRDLLSGDPRVAYLEFLVTAKVVELARCPKAEAAQGNA